LKNQGPRASKKDKETVELLELENSNIGVASY